MHMLGGATKHKKVLVCHRSGDRLHVPRQGGFNSFGGFPVTEETPRNLGFSRLGSFFATAETPQLGRLDRSGFVTLLSFALVRKNRFRAFCSLHAGRFPLTRCTSSRKLCGPTTTVFGRTTPRKYNFLKVLIISDLKTLYTPEKG